MTAAAGCRAFGGGVLRSGQWSAALTLSHAPEALHQRIRVDNGLSGFKGRPRRTRGVSQRRQSRTALLAIENSKFGGPDLCYQQRGGGIATRFDSEQLLPKVRGAFFEWELSYAGRRTKYASTGNILDDSLLLGGFGFGAYHGDPTTRGGETRSTTTIGTMVTSGAAAERARKWHDRFFSVWRRLTSSPRPGVYACAVKLARPQ